MNRWRFAGTRTKRKRHCHSSVSNRDSRGCVSTKPPGSLVSQPSQLWLRAETHIHMASSPARPWLRAPAPDAFSHFGSGIVTAWLVQPLPGSQFQTEVCQCLCRFLLSQKRWRFWEGEGKTRQVFAQFGFGAVMVGGCGGRGDCKPAFLSQVGFEL